MSVLKITSENVESEVMQSVTPVLLDFWASWCMPCKMLSPTIDEIAGEVEQRVKVGKVNVDEEPKLAQKFNVMSIPTLVIIKDGKVQSTSVGVRSKQEILGMLE